MWNLLCVQLASYLDCAGFDYLHPSQHFFRHVGTDLPADKVSCSKTQPMTAPGETRTRNLLIPGLTLYQLSHCPPLLPGGRLTNVDDAPAKGLHLHINKKKLMMTMISHAPGRPCFLSYGKCSKITNTKK